LQDFFIYRFDTADHSHAIDVALALEMSIAGCIVAVVIWLLLMALLAYLRSAQRRRMSAEMAATVDDARAYQAREEANGFMMDQMSNTSSQLSSNLQKPGEITLQIKIVVKSYCVSRLLDQSQWKGDPGVISHVPHQPSIRSTAAKTATTTATTEPAATT